MAYIGLPPKANFTSGLLDRFTSTTGTTVTLTHDISSENDIVVFVNFVKQDSTTYSVGGTGNKTLTLGGTLVSSDIVEVHYLNIVGQTVAPSSGSVTTATINDTAVTGAKLNTDVISAQTELATAPASTDELLVSDSGVLKRVDVSLVGGTNTPSFYAYKSSSDNSITDNVYVKVTLESELLDSDSAWDVSTSKFTPQVAGKYLIMGAVYMYGSSVSTLRNSYALIYKNGSEVGYARTNFQSNDIGAHHITYQVIVDMNGSSDYVELYGACDITSGTPYFATGSKSTYMCGYKLIGA